MYIYPAFYRPITAFGRKASKAERGKNYLFLCITRWYLFLGHPQVHTCQRPWLTDTHWQLGNWSVMRTYLFLPSIYCIYVSTREKNGSPVLFYSEKMSGNISFFYHRRINHYSLSCAKVFMGSQMLVFSPFAFGTQGKTLWSSNPAAYTRRYFTVCSCLN